MATNQSEVARLLQQIDAEHAAADLGLHGFAEGASHEAITAREKNIGVYHQQLAGLIGAAKATELVFDIYNSERDEKGGRLKMDGQKSPWENRLST